MTISDQSGAPGKRNGNAMYSAPIGTAGQRGPAQSSTMTVGDIWYALFRHKWKVIVISLLGFGAAGFLYVKNKPPYVSEAKLLVRYVVESRTGEALTPDGQVSTPSRNGETIVNSEKEILLSLDLCRQVAESIGPTKILGETGGSNLTQAAAMIYGGLEVEIPRYSTVIKVRAAHPNPEVAQLVLQQLIESYLKRHAEIHRGLGTMDGILAQQTDQVRSRLTQTDQELQELRTKAGVLSLEDSRREITEQMGNIRQMIFATEAELAEYQLLIKASSMEGTNTSSTGFTTNTSLASRAVPPPDPPTSDRRGAGPISTNASAVVGGVAREEYRKSLLARIEILRQQEQDLRELRLKAGPAGAGDAKHSYTDQIGRVRQMILTAEAELAEYSDLAKAQAVSSNSNPVSKSLAGNEVTTLGIGSNALGAVQTTPPAASERFLEYKALLTRLEGLHRQELELRNIYTDGNRTLIRVREQLAEAELARRALERENPAFVTYMNLGTGNTGATSASPLPVLTPPNGGDPNRIRALEAKLKVLYAQLDKQKQEATALEQFETQLNQLLRKRELDEKNYRHFAAGLEQTRFDEALGSGKLANISVLQAPSPARLSSGKRTKIAGIALAAGLVGGIGLALLIELMLDHSVRRSAQLEASLALPLLSTIPRTRLPSLKRRPKLTNGGTDSGLDAGAGLPPEIPGWSVGHPLRAHIEALRDRTLMHFEGDLRKPKLIGVTSCREGAGVTTIACGLAAALSEAADGRVLLINLDVGSQSLHPFLLGREACSLVDVVEAGKRETALIGNNLYVASNLGEPNGGAAMQPTSIARILPKIKMSDYDYVVFDMPTVSPTSISGKLAGMVDLVFMVVESEKDSQKSLKRACQLLAESNATFRVVLNKFERYVPKWLDQET